MRKSPFRSIPFNLRAIVLMMLPCRINAAAAVRRYDVNPRLDYRTVSAVNGK